MSGSSEKVLKKSRQTCSGALSVLVSETVFVLVSRNTAVSVFRAVLQRIRLTCSGAVYVLASRICTSKASKLSTSALPDVC